MSKIIGGLDFDFVASAKSTTAIINYDTSKPSDARMIVADLATMLKLPKVPVGMQIHVLNTTGLTQDSDTTPINDPGFNWDELVQKTYRRRYPSGVMNTPAAGDASHIDDWVDISGIGSGVTSIKGTIDVRLESYQVGSNPDLADATLRGNLNTGDLYLVKNCYNPIMIALANTKLALIISMDNANGQDANALIEQDLLDIGVVVDDWVTNSAAIKSGIAGADLTTLAGGSDHNSLVAEVQTVVNTAESTANTAVPKSNKTIDDINGRTAPIVNTSWYFWNGSDFDLITPAYGSEPTEPLYDIDEQSQFEDDVKALARVGIVAQYDGVTRFKEKQLIYNDVVVVINSDVQSGNIIENEKYQVNSGSGDTVTYDGVTYNPGDKFTGQAAVDTFIVNGGGDAIIDLIEDKTNLYVKLTDNDSGAIHQLTSTSDYKLISSGGSSSGGSISIDDTINNTRSALSTPVYSNRTLSAEEILAVAANAAANASLSTGLSGGSAATEFDSNGVPI